MANFEKADFWRFSRPHMARYKRDIELNFYATRFSDIFWPRYKFSAKQLFSNPSFGTWQKRYFWILRQVLRIISEQNFVNKSSMKIKTKIFLNKSSMKLLLNHYCSTSDGPNCPKLPQLFPTCLLEAPEPGKNIETEF